MEKNTMIFSGFPGVGKTYYAKNTDLKVLDSDSSTFSWISKGVRNPDFPTNYMEHIKSNIGKVDVIFVSTHKDVRNSLVALQLPFTLVYPRQELKEEYLERFRKRGSIEGFVSLMEDNWGTFLSELHKQQNCDKIELCSNSYIGYYVNAPNFLGEVHEPTVKLDWATDAYAEEKTRKKAKTLMDEQHPLYVMACDACGNPANKCTCLDK